MQTTPARPASSRPDYTLAAQVFANKYLAIWAERTKGTAGPITAGVRTQLVTDMHACLDHLWDWSKS